ncbi:hypothetical protein AgCh_033907 [Apium graveolens]
MPEIIVPYGSLSCLALTKEWYLSFAHVEPTAKRNVTWLILPGSILKREPEKRLPHPRKAAGAQITNPDTGSYLILAAHVKHLVILSPDVLTIPMTKPTPRNRPSGVTQAKTKVPRQVVNTKGKEPVLNDHNEKNEQSDQIVNPVEHRVGEFNPMIVDEFLGCDVVLDDDQNIEDVLNGDDLETFETELINTADEPVADAQVTDIVETEITTDGNVVTELVGDVEPSKAGDDSTKSYCIPIVGSTTMYFGIIEELCTNSELHKSPVNNQKRRTG